MTLGPDTELLGKGIYTLPDASRLSGVSSARIRRWLNRRDGASHWYGELSPIDGKYALGFLDLQEIRFIRAFLEQGVTWHVMRKVRQAAHERYRTRHPFCTRRFVTDGSQMMEKTAAEAVDQDDYEEFLQGQRVFPSVIEPFIKELEFADDDRVIRWWPLGPDRQIVLDPKRRFGQPIATEAGIATAILYAAHQAGNGIDEIADWYEIESAAIRDAIEFEEKIAA